MKKNVRILLALFAVISQTTLAKGEVHRGTRTSSEIKDCQLVSTTLGRLSSDQINFAPDFVLGTKKTFHKGRLATRIFTAGLADPFAAAADSEVGPNISKQEYCEVNVTITPLSSNQSRLETETAELGTAEACNKVQPMLSSISLSPGIVSRFSCIGSKLSGVFNLVKAEARNSRALRTSGTAK